MAFQPYKITEEQAATLLAARTKPSYERKRIKKSVFSAVHSKYPSIGRAKIRIFIENPNNPDYLVLRDKATGKPFGVTVPDPVPVTQAVSPAAEPAKPAKPKAAAKPAKAAAPAKEPAKKAAVKPKAAKPAAAKAAPKAAKAAVKPKAAAKPAAKVAAKAAPKAAKPAVKAAPKAAKPAVKAAAKPATSYPKDIRITINGVRKRLGVAKSAAEEKRMIAAAKA